MRKAVKFLHSLASCGMIGALAGYLVLLSYGPQDTPAQYAATRKAISVLCDYILVPSLGVVLVSGFVSMLVHKPYMQKGWVWAKALTTIGIFESTMVVVQSKATFGAEVSAKIAKGAADASELGELGREWGAIGVVLTLAVANVLVGVWRPKIEKWGAAGRKA
jgi:hypothetical protein